MYSALILVLEKLDELGPERSLVSTLLDDVGVPILLVGYMQLLDETVDQLEIISQGIVSLDDS